MIPTGVARIIWAIAPTAELRDAMLGDFIEEYDARVRRDGLARARGWCWREALRSLGGTVCRSWPECNQLFTSVVPAVFWSCLVAACTATAATMLFLPAIFRFVPVSRSAAWMIAMGPMALFAVVLAGYEAARVGRRAPLWSALMAGLIFAVSLRAIAVVWFWPALMLLAPACCVAGAVLQQAQAHRLAWEIARQS